MDPEQTQVKVPPADVGVITTLMPETPRADAALFPPTVIVPLAPIVAVATLPMAVIEHASLMLEGKVLFA